MKLTNEELNKIMTKADNDLDELKMRNHELYEENQELQTRIGKAIECIEKIWKDTEHKNIYSIIGIGLLRTQLLNILQGENNE